MPRIPDILERESRTVDLEPGDFERLLHRRERTQRSRRIRAGALGIIVALAMGFVLVRSLTSAPIPANQPVEPAPAPLSGAIVGMAPTMTGKGEAAIQFAVFRLVLDWSVKPTAFVGQRRRTENDGPFSIASAGRGGVGTRVSTTSLPVPPV